MYVYTNLYVYMRVYLYLPSCIHIKPDISNVITTRFIYSGLPHRLPTTSLCCTSEALAPSVHLLTCPIPYACAALSGLLICAREQPRHQQECGPWRTVPFIFSLTFSSHFGSVLSQRFPDLRPLQ